MGEVLGLPLVRASGTRRAGLEVADILGRQVIANREPGLEEEHGRTRIRDQLALVLENDMAGRAANVDPRERVARVGDEQLLLVEPLVDGLPGDRDVAWDVIQRRPLHAAHVLGREGEERSLTATPSADPAVRRIRSRHTLITTARSRSRSAPTA